VVTVEAEVVMGVVEMAEAEVVTKKVVAANHTTLTTILTTAAEVIVATQENIVMKRENMDVMTQAVTVVITVITGERALATTMEEDIMGDIVMGKRAERVQVSVKVDHIRKGTTPRDITG
jgi:hypothetical protein